MSQYFYSPFNAISQLHRELGRVVDQPKYDDELSSANESTWQPKIDIVENKGNYAVLADLPGLEPKDVELTLHKNVLTIRGERKINTTSDEDTIRRRERRGGTFQRQFTLPETTDIEHITAKSTNGVLKITIPKGKKHTPLSIKVTNE